MMGRIRGWVAAIFGVLLLVILFQNLERTAVDFLFWRVEAPLLAIMAVCAAVGVVLGALAIAAFLSRRGGQQP